MYIENLIEMTGGIIMKKKSKNRSIENKGGIHRNHYIGIFYNGDQRVYRKATVRALKKGGDKKTLIKAVKAADGDLEISRLLIEADRFDVLVDVFSHTDARTAVWDYIENILGDVVDEYSSDLANIEKSFSETIRNFSEDADKEAVLAEYDKCIDNQCLLVCKELGITNDAAKEVLKKYQVACTNKLKEINKERQRLIAEKKRLEAIISKI